MGLFNRKKNEKIAKVIELVMKVISMPCSILDIRYRKSHGRVAIIYSNGDIKRTITFDENERVLKYGASTFKLKKKVYKRLVKFFNAELDHRVQKQYFENLEEEINNQKV